MIKDKQMARSLYNQVGILLMSQESNVDFVAWEQQRS